MRILITGGNGFIGTHLRTALKMEKDTEVFVFDRDRVNYPGYLRGDLCDYFSVEDAFAAADPDRVIHLAAMVSRRECEETPAMALKTNVEGTLNITRLCKKGRIPLIYAGSSEEYGTAFNEGKRVNEATPFGAATSVYSMTKRMAEEVIEYSTGKDWFKACTLRFFMLYGPGEKASDYRSAVIRFIDWSMKGEPINVHADTERSWCYIGDAVQAIIAATVREYDDTVPSYQAINIGKDDPIKTPALAKKIREMTRSQSKIQVVPPDPTIIPVKRASFVMAKTVLGWEASTGLAEGLGKTILGYVGYECDTGDGANGCKGKCGCGH